MENLQKEENGGNSVTAKPVDNQRILRSRTRNLPTKLVNALVPVIPVKGCQTRSFMPQDNVQDVPQLVRVGPLACNGATEEGEKTQKTCEHENESLR